MWYVSPVVKNMDIENPTGEDGAGSPYARLVGQRLRSIRAQKKLSLDAVEELRIASDAPFLEELDAVWTRHLEDAIHDLPAVAAEALEA